MLSTQDAFRRFRSRLELTASERADASRRQQDIRAVMQADFDVKTDFLTGSYARWTKTKPLKDVDIFCVLGDEEQHYRDEPPAAVLAAARDILAATYGHDCVSLQRRSVTVQFGVSREQSLTAQRVMSFDVVPAFVSGDHFCIPDTGTVAGWTETNPRVHYDLAVDANAAYAGEWKGLVRMVKQWNRDLVQPQKPIQPSFLIEVMALEVLYPPFGGDYRREVQACFASLADRIGETWADPAGLGPAVSDRMDAGQVALARAALRAAEQQAAHAIWLEAEGKQGEALRAWRELFGPLFPLS
jgi:hypothetical protein